jgi:predicted transglutaminase-like cysteine proteinase
MQFCRTFVAAFALVFAVLAMVPTPAKATADPLGAAGVSLAAAFRPGGARTGAVAAIAKRWDRVLSTIAESRDPCPAGIKACASWHSLKRQLAGQGDRLSLLKRVNDALNRMEYFEDSRLWSLNDYWATPAEFLARRAGDCEDYAIAKYFLLLELGVPAAEMRIAIVRDVARRLTHAVLVVRTEHGPMLLDNVIEEVVPTGRAPQYRTLLALTGSEMSVYIDRTATAAAAP